MSTTRGFRARWRRQKAAYRNASGGRKNAERRKLVLLVAEELKRESNMSADSLFEYPQHARSQRVTSARLG